MTAQKSSNLRSIRVGYARAHKALGWSGLCGIVLMAAGALTLLWVQTTGNQILTGIARTGQVRLQVSAGQETTSPEPVKPKDLAISADIPLLLTVIEKAAVDNGIEWSAAQYRVTPATATLAASLEVRSTMRSTYPKLRAMIAQLLRENSSIALREFKLSRNSSDAQEVDASLKFAVLLQDAPALESSTVRVSP
jgi:hypothetical protein